MWRHNKLTPPKLLFGLAITLLSLSYGCKKAFVNQPDVATTGMANGKSSDFLLTETGIGKKLENPYTVANMRKALADYNRAVTCP